MLIGLDGIPLTEPKTGVGHYAAELARALAFAAPDSQFEFVYPSTYPPFGEGADEAPPAGNLRVRRVPVGAVGRHWWSAGLPRHLRAERGYALFHGTNFEVPLWGDCPSVLTVHDLSTLMHPDTHTARNVWRARRRLPLMARRASAIITPTEAVRREVCARLRAGPEKVFAVHEAARAVFRPAPREESAALLRSLGVGDDFILAVGTIEPRKNLKTLVRAFAELLRWGGAARGDLQLVIAGRRGWLNEEFTSEVERSGVRGRVVFTGYVTDEQLRALYSSCRAFAYPSLYEGFGLPVLEAMACGAPVVAGRIASVAEVAGGAALLVPPRDAGALARALTELLDDAGACARLSAAGREHAALFSWERAARQTLDIYERVTEGARRGRGGRGRA